MGRLYGLRGVQSETEDRVATQILQKRQGGCNNRLAYEDVCTCSHRLYIGMVMWMRGGRYVRTCVRSSRCVRKSFKLRLVVAVNFTSG